MRGRALGLLRIVVLWLLLALPGAAQSIFPAGEPSAPAPDAAAEPDAAARLLEILRDEAARAELIRQLEAAAAAADPAALPPAEPAPQVTLARQIADYTRAVAEGSTAFVLDMVTASGNLFGAFTAGTAVNWAEINQAFTSLLLVGGVTLALFFALRAVGARIYAEMGRRTLDGGWLNRVLLILGSSVIDALIIVVAWAGGYAFALVIEPPGTMDFRQSLFLNAFLLIEMTKVVLRGIFAPNFATLRFAPMSDTTAAYWYFWASRLVSLLGYGILLVVPIINAAVSFAVGRSVTVLIVVTALLVAILIILQNRRQIASALRARHERNPEDMIGRIEAYLAGFWHWLAIAYLIALFVVWTMRPADALPFMLRATLHSVVAVVLGVIVMALISRAITRGLRVPDDLRVAMPLLEERINAYVPTILKVIRLLVILAVLIAIGQAWQVINFVGWAATGVGRDLTGRVVSALLVVLIAMGVWVAVSSFIEYRLNPEVGHVPTARERTLLALLRNAFAIALIIMAAMLALSQLGVNIAPLLAGAGVLGLAIGFGAQKLVQDIITGAFIQVENAMNEGDVVTVGSTTGVVEKLTIRSVGLRTLDGTYHLIPFSSVDMVSNFMKGFAYHIANVGVAYREDVGQVKELMQKAFDILRETDHGQSVIGEFEIQGVAELGESSVVVRGRIKTLPGLQWAVGRAYNEIIKQVLDEAGVEIPFPHMTLYMGQDKDGSAPPLNLRRAPALRASPRAPAATAVERDVDAPASAERSPPAGEVVTDADTADADRAAAIRRALPTQDEVEDR
jgi:moderate conductance mechanosensitive channel